MTGLGFESYAAQGGDIGSAISCDLAQTYPSCKGMVILITHSNLRTVYGLALPRFNEYVADQSIAVHINFKGMLSPPEGTPEYKGPPLANEMMLRLQNFAYAMEHATRPSTVGLVVGCNPISLLAWYVHHCEREGH